tara:strand:+ start:8771 stop:9094 length:324 start_codon:yes stop_codon:yes gene_type:complete
MAINALGIRNLLMMLAKKGGGDSLTNKAIVRGLSKGRSPKSMAELKDARRAGFKGRREGLYENEGDYPFGYVGPDPGDIGELEELQRIVELEELQMLIELITKAGRR